MTAIFDIETDGLYYDVTKIHSIAIKIDNQETAVYASKPLKGTSGTIEEGLALLGTSTCLVGHNIISYDLPVIQKLYPAWKYSGKLRDTLLMSKLAYPNIMLTDANRKTIPPKLKGSHSLKAWGYRLRKLKGDYGDKVDAWENLTEEMVEYNRQDVEVTYELYKKLDTKVIPEEAIRIEQEFARIISRQEKYGVWFDKEKAQQLHVKLLEDVDEAERQLGQVFKPLKDFVEVKKAEEYTKAGKPSKLYKNQIAKGCYTNDKGVWGYDKEVVFNPSSRHHIARWLQEVYGWKPTEFTEKNSIIVNEKVLKSLEFPEGKVLAHYFEVKKLLAMLAEGDNAWMKMLKEDGRIHGNVDTLGAVSRRCTHRSPNMAQVPSIRAFKGYEARELFAAPKGKKIVGCDAEGLELRTLSHYMARYDGGKYGKIVDEGDKDNGTDVHSENQRSAGLSTRDEAKTFIYAFLYGAGDAKIGQIIGGTAEEGRRIKAKFFKKIPAVKRLIERVASVYKDTKTLKALDGNPFHIRSEHSALNTLLQGAGALVMKYYLIELDKKLEKLYTNSSNSKSPQYEFILNIHDEVQIECDEGIAEPIKEITKNTFDDVTKLLNFRVPLRGESVIGNNWAETH